MRYALDVSPRESVLADRELLESVESIELAPDERDALDQRIKSMERGEGIAVDDAFIDSLDR
jgi:hypothetical protein